MASHRPSQIRSEIEIAKVTTEDPAHSVHIMDDSTASPHVQTMGDSVDELCSSHPKLFQTIIYLVSFLVGFVGLGAILAAPFVLLFLVAFVVFTLAQLVKHGPEYDKVSNVKSSIRLWLVIASFAFIGSMLIIIQICDNIQKLNYVRLGLSFTTLHPLMRNLWLLVLLNGVVSGFIPRYLPPIPLGYNESGLNVREALHEIADCVFTLLYVRVIKKSSIIKTHEILGLYTWKWLWVILLVVIGYNVIRVSTHLTACGIRKLLNMHGKYWQLVEKLMPRDCSYYTNGLKTNINFILCSLLNLLTWVLYFGPRLSKTPQAEKITLFGTRTFVSVLIFSVLWLFKRWVVLSWEASAMYVRLRSQLLDSKNQLYFLGLLGRHNHDIFKLMYYGQKVQEPTGISNWFMLILKKGDPDFWDRSMSDKEEEVEQEEEERQESDDKNVVKKLSVKKRKATKDNLLMHNRTPNTHDMKQVADYLISAKTALFDPTFVMSILNKLASGSDLRGKLKRLIYDDSNPNASRVQPAKNDSVIENDWLYFERMTQTEDECSDTLVRTWMEKARSNCSYLANTLSSTKELVDVLNKIVSCLLIGATFILWLLLTRLATTKILVIVVSPLLAATFIFGDTCKTLFQGIMYVYVVHPIRVGDLCSVDDIMLVVQTVGVWTTTFWKVDKLGTSEVVTYPNSELAMKVVINNLSEVVWEDCLEIPLGATVDKLFAKKLEQEIKAYLKAEDELMTCSHTVKVIAQEDEEDELKMVIKLKYKIIKIQHWSYEKCVRRKDAVEKRVLQFMEEQNTTC